MVVALDHEICTTAPRFRSPCTKYQGATVPTAAVCAPMTDRTVGSASAVATARERSVVETEPAGPLLPLAAWGASPGASGVTPETVGGGGGFEAPTRLAWSISVTTASGDTAKAIPARSTRRRFTRLHPFPYGVYSVACIGRAA